MKKCLIIAIFVVIFLGITQCKKKVNEVISYNKKAVNITLDVGEGSKTNVNPETGAVSFEYGDEIIVANNGVYVGKLIYEKGFFRGTITNPSDDDYLHFYHLGNRDVGELTEGESVGCSVSIADQTTSLPVISYARSTEHYSDGVTVYSAHLRNKCALVRFDVTTLSENAGVCVTGMRNKVDVDFSACSFDYLQDGDGAITLSSRSGTKWAILLPQPPVAAEGVGSAYSGAYVGERGSVPEINENDYLPEGVAVTIHGTTVPAGARNGVFSINPQGDKVRFSMGNLIYQKKTDTWTFYENQYEQKYLSTFLVGEFYALNNPVENYGWATSGFNHGAVLYSPRSTQNTNANYYAYGNANKNIYDENGTADWGYNAITNGGNAYKQWRTLTNPEWRYIIEERDGASDKMGLCALQIGKYKYGGMLLLPDDWTEPYPDCFEPGALDYTTNVYNDDQWLQMEGAGAVFLTCGGQRINLLVKGLGTQGLYWSSSCFDANKSYCVSFENGSINHSFANNRSYGLGVRVVVDVE